LPLYRVEKTLALLLGHEKPYRWWLMLLTKAHFRLGVQGSNS